MFNRTTATKFFAPRLRPRTDQPWAEPNSQKVLTADFRRLSQTKNSKEQSAKRIASTFKPSAFTCQRIASDSLLLAAYCLLLTLYALRHALSALLSALICVNLWLLAFDALRLAPWNTDSIEVDSFARSAIPQGESLYVRFPKSDFNEKCNYVWLVLWQVR